MDASGSMIDNQMQPLAWEKSHPNTDQPLNALSLSRKKIRFQGGGFKQDTAPTRCVRNDRWFQTFFMFTPKPLGKWSNLTCAYFFRWSDSTTNFFGCLRVGIGINLFVNILGWKVELLPDNLQRFSTCVGFNRDPEIFFLGTWYPPGTPRPPIKKMDGNGDFQPFSM